MTARTKKEKPAEKKRMGRPPIENPAKFRINFRVTPDQRDRYHAAAAASDMTLTGWIEKLLDRAAART